VVRRAIYVSSLLRRVLASHRVDERSRYTGQRHCPQHQEQNMPIAYGTPQYWRERAEEARAMAEGIIHPEVKQAMLLVSESYEKIAKRAEAHAAGGPPREG